MDCRHQRDSAIGRMLRSCAACEIEQMDHGPVIRVPGVGPTVRYACARCSRFWATEAELSGHRCVNVGAALEAAERVVNAVDDEPVTEVALDGQIYAICDTVAWPDGKHAADCAWQALKAALRGEALTR